MTHWVLSKRIIFMKIVFDFDVIAVLTNCCFTMHANSEFNQGQRQYNLS